MVGLFLKNTTLCGKILHFVVKHSVLWYNITFCSTFVVYLWYICDIFVVFFAMGNYNQLKKHQYLDAQIICTRTTKRHQNCN